MTRTIRGRYPHYQFRDQDPVLDIAWFFARTSGLSIAQMAANSGVSQGTLYAWFYAKTTTSPRHSTVAAFLASFGVDIHSIPAEHRSPGRSNVVRLHPPASKGRPAA